MFIAIPTGMNYQTERYPVVTLSLIGTNTLVWLVSLICEICTQGDSQDWVMRYLWLIPDQSLFWTYLTSMFVHAGFFHLLGNMIFLFLFGSCVEDMIGRLRFTLFYLGSGFIAELAYIAMTPAHFTSDIPMGGASGAISGCLGMYLLLRASANIEFKYFLWLFFVYLRAGEFEVPAWIPISLWFLKDLVFALLGMFSNSGPGGGVAFGAHVGGLLAGVALISLYKWRIRPAEQAEGNSGYILDPAKVLATMPRPALATTTATSETPTIMLHDGINQTGPFTLTHIQSGLRAGTISPDAVYWTDGMDAWQSVKELSDVPM